MNGWNARKWERMGGIAANFHWLRNEQHKIWWECSHFYGILSNELQALAFAYGTSHTSTELKGRPPPSAAAEKNRAPIHPLRACCKKNEPQSSHLDRANRMLEWKRQRVTALRLNRIVMHTISSKTANEEKFMELIKFLPPCSSCGRFMVLRAHKETGKKALSHTLIDSLYSLNLCTCVGAREFFFFLRFTPIPLLCLSLSVSLSLSLSVAIDSDMCLRWMRVRAHFPKWK